MCSRKARRQERKGSGAQCEDVHRLGGVGEWDLRALGFATNGRVEDK